MVVEMADTKSRVKVHSTLTVVSSIPVEPGTTHPLSLLDHSMGLHTIHMVFYYRNNPGNNSGQSFDMDNIRVSLSEVLSKYPPVTGRLTRGEDGNWKVKCTDAGVRVLIAKVETTLDEWLRSASWYEERDLTVWLDMPEDPHIWSPFRIQINDFEGGGLAIGLSCTHMHADPTTATLVLKSWSEQHFGKALAHPPFFNPTGFQGRPVPNTSTKSANYYAIKSKAETPPSTIKMSTATFRFSDSMIKQCLSEITDKCPNATPFNFLTALFWTRIVLLKPPTMHSQNTNSLSICIDSRKLLHEPLPDGYFGNAQHFSLLSMNAEELEGGAEVGHVAGIVNHHVTSIEEEEFRSVLDWFESQKDEGGKVPPPFRMYGPELTCISMEHMIISSGSKEDANSSLMYSSMFDKDEKPIHVSCHFGNVEGEGLIVVMPSPEEGLGRTVMVTLPEEQVVKICHDEAIMQLKPTMLFIGK